MPEDYEGPEGPGGPDNLDEPPSFFPYGADEGAHERRSRGEMVEVQIEGVFATESNGSITRFVLLAAGDRQLPISIGPAEAVAIQAPLEGARPDRPMTQDLVKNILERLEYDLDRVVIDDFWNTIFYAKLYLRGGPNDEEIEIDARPSDAIALAVRFGSSIYVAEGVLDATIEE